MNQNKGETLYYSKYTAQKYIKENLTKLKAKTHYLTIIGTFDILLSIMDRSQYNSKHIQKDLTTL